MVIVLEKNISDENKENIRDFLNKNHFRVNEITGDEDTIFGAVGKLGIDPRAVEVMPGVSRVIPISKPYKMASREFKKENTVVEISNSRGEIIRVGGSKVIAIAGPCSVENRDQMMTIARHVAASGAVMLRGGAFKPRTSPYAFQGLGEEGVRLLKEAGDAFGLPVVSEIVSSEHIAVMRDYIDVFQIGARNMQNFELLKRVGETGKPVMLKRGLSATIEDLLMAAEYLLSSGTDNVILCERGIRTFEPATRNTLDLSAIPVLRSLTHLPLIVDPSHAVGIRDKIAPMALASIAAGADGIIVEVHCNPEKAFSDGAQSLYPGQFDKLMRDIDVLAPVVGKEVARIRKSFPVGGESAGTPSVEHAPVSAGKDPARTPQTKICAFMGSPGAYADQAINRFFAGSVEEVSFSSFRDMFRAVSEGRADYGMVPIENSLAGSVYDNYDNLSRFEDINIAGAITLRIEHSLLAVPGATMDSIRYVYSHPHGFPQCTDFLEKHPGWKLVEAESTATAAVIVAEKGVTENAAIASDLAAHITGLIELARGIESNTRNYTRFVVIAHENTVKRAEGQSFLFPGDITKASIIFVTKNAPGALYECLGVFHKNGLNLTRLESRPVPGEPWRHSFYADVDISGSCGGSADTGTSGAQKIVDGVLAELKSKTEDIRLLGLYRERDC